MNSGRYDGEMVARITAAVRIADQNFQQSGGSSRHWVAECLLPELESAGLRIVTVAAIERGEHTQPPPVAAEEG